MNRASLSRRTLVGVATTMLVASMAAAVAGAVGAADATFIALPCLVWSLLWAVCGSLVTIARWLRSAPIMALGQFTLLVGYGLAGVAAGMGRPSAIWVGLAVAAIGGPVFTVGLMIGRGEAAEVRTFVRHLMDVLVTTLALLLVLWQASHISPAGGIRPWNGELTALVMFGMLLVPSVLVTAQGPWLTDSLRSAVGPILFAVVPSLLLAGATLGPVRTLDLVRLTALAAVWAAIAAVLVPRPPHSRPMRSPADPDTPPRTLLTILSLAAVTLTVTWQFGSRQMDPTLLTLLIGFLVVMSAREALNGQERGWLVQDLMRQARRDELTGLGNRRDLHIQLRLLHHSGVNGSVIVLDVDRFKAVNDEFGRARGDAVLVQMAELLRHVCQLEATPDLTAHRLSGDEFVVLVPGEPARAERVARRVQSKVVTLAHGTAETRHLTLTASIGLAPLVAPPLGPDGTVQTDPTVALTRASRALRVAKRSRNSMCWFDDAFEASSHRQATIERRLREVLTTPGDPSLSMHYQPIVHMSTGHVVGLEALARWDDPELGPVSPAEFIPLAEETGLVHRLGRFALAEATRVLSELLDLDVYITVNVSPVQLRRPGFLQEVMSLLEREGTTHSRLTLEVTEGIFMDPQGVAAQTILELAAAGVRIAIDDFGSGYSSLGYISRLPAKVLKMDRSLVCGVEEPRTRAVLSAITTLSAELGLDVVMEGVEDDATSRSLQALGATTGQGWLWSRAVPEQDLVRVFAELGVAAPHQVLPSQR